MGVPTLLPNLFRAPPQRARSRPVAATHRREGGQLGENPEGDHLHSGHLPPTLQHCPPPLPDGQASPSTRPPVVLLEVHRCWPLLLLGLACFRNSRSGWRNALGGCSKPPATAPPHRAISHCGTTFFDILQAWLSMHTCRGPLHYPNLLAIFGSDDAPPAPDRWRATWLLRLTNTTG